MKGAVSVKLLSAWRKTVKMTASNVLLSALPEQMEEHTLVRCRIGLRESLPVGRLLKFSEGSTN